MGLLGATTRNKLMFGGSKKPFLEHAIGRLLHTLIDYHTTSQSMKLFTAKKDLKKAWPEHYLYMMAMSDACNGGAEAQVLDNIVNYAYAN